MPFPDSGPKRGRKCTLTDELQSEMVKLMQAGNYYETAAACCGLHPETGRVWMRKGAKAKTGRYRRFFVAIKEAEAFAEASALTRIRQAGAKVWQADAWFLERRMPQKWGRWERKVDEGEGEERRLTLTTENMEQSDG